jgi:membrane-associated phospholipid phosphatase
MGPPRFVGVQRLTFTAIALVSLLSFALLATDLAHGHGLYSFERPLLRSLGSPSSVGAWVDFADLLAFPAIITVLVVAFAFGALRRTLVRVAVYAGFAAVAFLMSELVAKPLVHETHDGHLTFPSGNVTAVCATAVAMWLALRPLLRRWARGVTLLLGAAWVLLMSVAVVGAHWHTPFDALGSVLLSLGIITAGGAFYEPGEPRGPTGTVDLDASWLATEDDALTSDVRGTRARAAIDLLEAPVSERSLAE